MKKLILLIVSIFATFNILSQDLTLDEIISNFLEANSQNKLLEMVTIKTTGTGNQQGADIKVIVYQKRPDKLRQDLEVQGMNIIVAIEGETGWTINPMAGGSSDPQNLPNETLKRLIWEELHVNPVLNWENPFMNYKEKGKVELLGKQDFDGKSVYIIRFMYENNPNLMVNYFIDTEKFVVLSQRSLRTQMGHTYEYEERYDDYRDIDGILCPFMLKTLINEQVITTITVDSYEFDIPIDDSIFRKPVKNQE